ncbi:hypothetical protein LV457_09035 [Mycobacterium sp. MYCO198283]|uniref:hypothetical protein n=1 Tax=Mycobacterium sp. MYCO198283 TaxID=2883505 RepID=UPI001E3FBD63|nr:hypothetical protein [Mycobacterium sp. MYCO198283]MCG5432437.1 hypothetical protein [Mycobacterium sp. MYCO198283]
MKATPSGIVATAAAAVTVAFAPLAGADPAEDVVVGPPPAQPAAAGAPAPEAAAACASFAEALDVAATHYGNFADALADQEGDYNDQWLTETNTVGRTALRQAAGQALSAANTPGLAPDIANPMRAWSWDATKLLVGMGVRETPESINAKATELNNDTEQAQFACAAAGATA